MHVLIDRSRLTKPSSLLILRSRAIAHPVMLLVIPGGYTAAGPSLCDALIRMALVRAHSTAATRANETFRWPHRTEIESGALLHAELTT
jgi:hypothetical protein